jgi:hypothetical protein
MTKDELVKVLEDNPPKQITEDIMGEPTQKMIDQKIEDLIEKEVLDELGPRPRYGNERMDWLDDYDRLIEQKSYRSNDYYDEAKEAVKLDGNWGTSKYDRPDWKLAGGENYREIVLKLPPTKSANQQRIMELEAYERRGATDKNLLDELAQLRASRDAAPDEFQSKHWDQPNVLAHIRVQDRVGPNGEKVLHVEEIQSDWHQTGRDKGYNTPEKRASEQKKLDDLVAERQQLLERQKQLEDLVSPYTSQGKDAPSNILDEWNSVSNRLNRLQTEQNRLGRNFGDTGVPDAPFKKNWHELAMKRLINYASENGYDKIAITPGAEQAKRYNIGNHIGQLNADEYDIAGDRQWRINAKDKSGNKVPISSQYLTDEELASHVGKELANKIINDRGGEYSGLDLHVGGEGMKGFYDQMLPAYLNKFGEKYGAKVGQIDLSSPVRQVRKENGWFTVDGIEDAGNPAIFNTAEEAQRAANAPLTNKLHSFDITPQMREEVLTKGQPLYQQIGIPAATGAAGAGMLEEEFDFKRGGKVSVTDNPDTMFLELNDKKFRRK